MCWNIWNIWSLDSYCRTELSFPSIVMFSLNSKLSMFYLFLDHSPPIFALLLLIFQSQRRYCFLWEPFLDPAYLSPNICAPIALCTCHHVNPCDRSCNREFYFSQPRTALIYFNWMQSQLPPLPHFPVSVRQIYVISFPSKFLPLPPPSSSFIFLQDFFSLICPTEQS